MALNPASHTGPSLSSPKQNTRVNTPSSPAPTDTSVAGASAAKSNSSRRSRLSRLIMPSSATTPLPAPRSPRSPRHPPSDYERTPENTDASTTLIDTYTSLGGGSPTTRSPTSTTLRGIKESFRSRSRTPPRTRDRKVSFVSADEHPPPVPPLPASAFTPLSKRTGESRVLEYTEVDNDFEPEAPPFSGRRPRAYVPGIPYPYTLTRDVQDHDDHDHHSFALSLRSVSLIKHATPPTRVLDIGCGTGAWVFSASNEWPNARFVGLDVAQAFPDLGAVSELLSDEKSTRGKRLSFSTSRRMSKEWKGRVNAKPSGKHDRIQFVEADFLQGLPFRDEEFDYVHVKGIAGGVPEHKWPFIFSEIMRVLRPTGTLEMVESNLTFPLPHSHTLLARTYEDAFDARDIALEPLSLIPGTLSMYLYGLRVIEFDDTSGLPWWAVDRTPLMRMRPRARSDALPPLSIKQVLPPPQFCPGTRVGVLVSATAENMLVAPPFFPQSVALPSSSYGDVPRTSSSTSKSERSDRSEKTSLSLSASQDPRMVMYQMYSLALVRAAGPALREYWVRKGGDRDAFDEIWWDFEADLLSRQQNTNITRRMSAFPSTYNGTLPTPRPTEVESSQLNRRKKKAPPNPSTLETPLRRVTKAFIARKATSTSLPAAPHLHPPQSATPSQHPQYPNSIPSASSIHVQYRTSRFVHRP